VDEVVFRSDLVWIGRFRCPPDHPLFVDSGPAASHHFVFPRTSVRIEHPGRPPFVTTPALATFYNPGEEYRRSAVSADGDHCDWFAVRADLAAEAVARRDPRAAERPETTFRFDHGPSDPATYLRQRLLLQEAAQGVADPLRIEEEVLYLLERMVAGAYARRTRAPLPAPLRPAHRNLVEDAKGFLAERFADSLSLAEVARGVGVSVYHLCRLFRRVTGETLHRHRSQWRLRRSLDLLAGGGDLTEVALDLGYSSHSHFSYEFRRNFGVSPRQVRSLLGGRTAGRAARKAALSRHEPLG
jgi:AraC-like DNA-binding protein